MVAEDACGIRRRVGARVPAVNTVKNLCILKMWRPETHRTLVV